MFSKNLALFQNRFPELYELLSPAINSAKKALPHLEIVKAKNGSLTAKDAGMLLHSSYNPEREAEQIVSKVEEGKDGAGIFLGFGLGYSLNAFCQKFPSRPLILVEPDLSYLLFSFTHFDWSKIFSHKDFIITTGANESEIVALIEHFGIEQCQIFANIAQTAHAKPFFDSVSALIKRNIQKAKINQKTMEKFSALWLKNSVRNLCSFASSEGISRYKNAALTAESSFPSIILAAGPSLSDILPHLSELKKRAILICVDTALRACLATGVEPDFIVITDPQYWAYKHIAGLKAPSSVLIAESAVYPSSLRFSCKEILMTSSLFPLGKYFETAFTKKGDIGAGGSVSTSAWDFARQIGSKEIFFAGLDLGFSSKNTHVKGSTAEENAHINSNRIDSVEKMSVASLYSANPFKAKDYLSRDILTDDKMQMFAWWFESNIIKALEQGQETFTFCPQNMHIPNVKVSSIEDFLSQKKEITREVFFKNAEKNKSVIFEKAKFDSFLSLFTSKVNTLYSNPSSVLQDTQLFEVAKALFSSEEYFSKLAANKEKQSDFFKKIQSCAELFLQNIEQR